MATRMLMVQYIGNFARIYDKPEREVERIKWFDKSYILERTCKLVIKDNSRPGKTIFNQWYACSECNSPAHPKDKYCSECGARVTEVE